MYTNIVHSVLKQIRLLSVACLLCAGSSLILNRAVCFPAERQFPGPPLGEKKKKKQNAQAFTQTEGKYVVTKFEHKLYSFSWNLQKKKKM